jgi:threonylcarbamoyladenosine tRNA methylthiotransferase CDKAL1
VLAGCLPRAQVGHAAALASEGIHVVKGQGPEDVADALASLEAAGQSAPSPLAPVAAHAGSLPDPALRTDAIVPIASGCMGACSYCITRLAWGGLSSLPAEEVVAEARSWLAEGFREVQLTAQDTGVWGRDLGHGTGLPDLVRAVASMEGAPGPFRVRVGMLNPDSLSGILGPLGEALRLHAVYRFAHVPVQSGSDRVLGLMRRRYTAREFEGLVGRLRTTVPGLTLHTDVICGFPTETEEDLGLTLELLRRVRPDVTNVKAFSPRPGTDAASMEGAVHGRTVKDRTRRVTALAGELTREALVRLVGGEADVLVTECGKGATMMGRDGSYHPVVLPAGECEGVAVGEVVRARIVGARGVYLLGEVC